mmetsp:Transcript_14517/g.28610  ORF Transcript_14517/g.28610 Transcript_14517/m.28610 type:complete len:349 (-) Transcript_14517:81-1127(-)|eukprot:CAMPEP_0172673028 /NCGR_PEP_ID=MMETSP1074-20121228/11900_1 /TAXON_ID=2916 /ORGANISM="Ceratium fusus, Strain PA161109" /LENGTH=348 /DNA_ID=CAMNT_0013490289 /DNA_START=90 /DNA_END=1136 /DNA_ORIENTATION=-
MGTSGGSLALICSQESCDATTVDDFDNDHGLELTVEIIGGRGLRSATWFPSRGDGGCFAEVMVCNRIDEVHRTRAEAMQLEPMWREELSCSSFRKGDALEFSVWNQDKKTCGLLGKAILEKERFFPLGFVGDLELESADGKPSPGRLQVRVKVGGDEASYPPEAPLVFPFTINHSPKTPLGIEFDTQDKKVAWVLAVKAGSCVHSYNKDVKQAFRLCPGDFVMRAHGVVAASSSKMVNSLVQDATLELMIVRPLEFSVAVDVQRQPLGLEFAKASGVALLIVRVTEGAVEELNKSTHAQKIEAGDRIVAVNGYRGKAAELLKRIKGALRFHMTVVSPAVRLVERGIVI